MNIPDDPNRHAVPDDARGNPVYEQTRQDMPLWCCGRNCGRNSRFVVLALGLIGIGCSIFVCLSPNYFTFESLRNDTFTDPAKQQPAPFEYATVANVGMFRYEILEVYEYPWPPERQRRLFDELHDREVERLMTDASSERRQETVGQSYHNRQTTTDDRDSLSVIDFIRRLQTGDRFGGSGNDDVPQNTFGNATTDGAAGGADVTNVTLPNMGGNGTNFLGDPSATAAPGQDGDIPDVLPGSAVRSDGPTGAPSASPTITNPNDIIAETVRIGVVLPYEEGIGQFDQTFTKGQRGAMLAPILAAVGLFFSLIELCCCTYKCSWLPTALFLYGAFMFQTMTIFLFMTQDFCKYDMECALGFAGLLSVVALLCYMIAQMLVCCTPRPPPFFNLCNKLKPKKKKRRPRRRKDPAADIIDNDADFDNDSDDGYDNGDGLFQDEPYEDNENENDQGYYDDNGDWDGGYNPENMQDNDDYDGGYDNDGYNDDGEYNNAGYNDDGYDETGYAETGYDDDARHDTYDPSPQDDSEKYIS